MRQNKNWDYLAHSTHAHRYIAKVPTAYGYRYFYTQEEYDSYNQTKNKKKEPKSSLMKDLAKEALKQNRLYQIYDTGKQLNEKTKSTPTRKEIDKFITKYSDDSVGEISGAHKENGVYVLDNPNEGVTATSQNKTRNVSHTTKRNR